MRLTSKPADLPAWWREAASEMYGYDGTGESDAGLWTLWDQVGEVDGGV